MAVDNPALMKKKYRGMLWQIAILFIIGVIVVGIITSSVIYLTSARTMESRLADSCSKSAKHLEDYIDRFPAHGWLLKYWYENYDKMDIEYDAGYEPDTETARKCDLMAQRHPEFQLGYAEPEEVEALSPEDRKLYAEIVYSWLITNMDLLQQDYEFDYVFGIVAEPPYDKEIILFIASDGEHERGDGQGMIFPIGKTIEANDEQRLALEKAAGGSPQTAYNNDGLYLDYYYSIGNYDGHDYILGLTRNVASFKTEIKNHAVSITILSILLLSTMAGLCLLMIFFAVLRPLRKVQKSIRIYKETKDRAAVTNVLSSVDSRNELGILSDDMLDLADEISDYTERIKKITSERERLETELDLASRIQHNMVPTDYPAFPGRSEFSVCGSMDTAKEVGGDFFDHFLVDDDHLCVVIADVSGKGIPAALFMMATMITLTNHAKMKKPAAQIMTDANKAICSRNHEEMFVTAWLGILEISTGKLTAVNAGHEYPFMMRQGSFFEMVHDQHFFVLGSIPDVVYGEYEMQMQPGDRLFLYTDGLPEATDAGGGMFGTERIAEELSRVTEASNEEVLEHMKQAVSGFVGEAEQFDDLTMMCLTYNGPGAGKGE